MNQRAIVIYCGLLLSVSAFSVDTVLPSFSALVADFDAPYSRAQWTITFYLFMAGVAQLLWGPLSDRIGRRPVLFAGLVIFLAGCLMSALAPSMTWLLAGRLLQGFGGAATTVLARAVVRDLFSGQELARALALTGLLFALGPILAPLVGAALTLLIDWRAIFAGLAVFALGLIVVLARLPETLASRAPEAVTPRVLLSYGARLWRHPQSRRFLLVSIVSMSSMLFILATVPRLYDAGFGVSTAVLAVMLAIHGTGIVVGQALNRRMIPRLGIVPAMLIGNLVLILASALILGISLAGLAGPWSMTALIVLFSTSHLVVYFNASALVLDPHGEIAGFAAAAYGFVSQIGSSLIVSALVVVTGDSVVVFAVILLAICLLLFAQIGQWHWARRRRA